MNVLRKGTMLDCSRNAVMRPEAVKHWVDLSADMGYNALMLYTEDTYEIPGEPYFGYGRGCYSVQELRELDDYAAAHGVELIPCIQTLAHLNTLKRWPAYEPHFDIDDVLLAGDEAVYALIEKMFDTVTACFRTHTVHIGMDEAHHMCRGRYYDQHGDADRAQVLLEHLNRVAEIGKKHGVRLCMWSDMFFRLACGGEYYAKDAQIDRSVSALIPENIELVYWDYYHSEKSHYDAMFTAHEALKSGTWFAGGLWTWTGFAPHNAFSIRVTRAALASCREAEIKNIFLTLWGDNGGECSRFALLPAMFYASQVMNGETEENAISGKFFEHFGVKWEDFMLLDLPGTANDDDFTNAEKYLLYQDPFFGLCESLRDGGENARYAACAERLRGVTSRGEFAPLFETMVALCDVLAIKAELCEKTRRAYKTGGEPLQAVLRDYRELEARLEVFYQAFCVQWDWENKPFGFEVQDVRLGGLMRRVRHCREMLEKYAAGECSRIEELEQPLLDLKGNGETLSHTPEWFNPWSEIVSAGII